ncbi:MAG: hypothetical protein J6X66_05935, partial [Lachnospiraceae bacterium]|nr:hypothetical protein [Lachnospiraceae bacterium]
TGDATAESEAEVLKSPALLKTADPAGGYDILKLGHHGSNTSTTAEFLELIAPKAVLISCGKDNPYGHPHKDVMERLWEQKCDIYRTDHMGAVTISARRGHLMVKEFMIEKSD